MICPHILEKAMASHSSTLAWKIPWMEEPAGLQSMGFLRVGHDWPCFHWNDFLRAKNCEIIQQGLH